MFRVSNDFIKRESDSKPTRKKKIIEEDIEDDNESEEDYI